MKNKKAFIAWCIGLIVFAVIMLGLLIAKGMGASIPDAVIRVLGTVEALACPIIMIVAVRTYNAEKNEKTEE